MQLIHQFFLPLPCLGQSVLQMTSVLSPYVAVKIDKCDSSCWAIGDYKNAKSFPKGPKGTETFVIYCYSGHYNLLKAVTCTRFSRDHPLPASFMVRNMYANSRSTARLNRYPTASKQRFWSNILPFTYC